jgi:hypothetical protein
MDLHYIAPYIADQFRAESERRAKRHHSLFADRAIRSGRGSSGVT